MGENKRNEEKNKKNVTGVSVGLGVVVLVYSVVDFCFPWGIIDSTKLTLAEVIAFFGAIITLSLIFRRLKNQEKQLQHQEGQLQNQEKQIELQMAQRLDDRFTTAVNLLGSDKTSARAGAIYSLYQLAVEDAKYRSQIAQILCSHVRSNTSEPEYQENHKYRPSNEIQTTINLLVRDDNNTGLYCQNFKEKLPPADFADAYLVGAKFREARCQGTDFSGHSAKAQILKMHGVKVQILVMHSAKAQILKMHNARPQFLKVRGARGQIFPRHNAKLQVL